jgi:hypothetical protein
MFTRAGRIGTAGEGPYVPGGTLDRLSRAGRGLAGLFVSRPRGISAGEADVPPAPAGSARRDANHTSPAMEAGITGGISLLGGGRAGSGRRGK